MPRIALVCTAHGFGHLTRSLEIAAALRRRQAEVTLFTASPHVALAWDPSLTVVEAQVDVGFVQADGITEDVEATIALLEQRCGEAAIDRLSSLVGGFDLVLADTAPSALEAARRAGVPAMAIGNFDWAWVYRHYEGLERWADTFAAWQASHPGIQLWPGPGLRGFAGVARFGAVGRSEPPDPTVAPRSVLVAFSAHGLPGGVDLLPHVAGVTWIVDDPLAGRRPDLEGMGGRRFPALVSAAGAVLTKPGYGIVAEGLLAGTALAWVPRGRFPEAPSLEAILRGRGDPMVRELTPAAVRVAVTMALDAPRPDPVGDPLEADRVADTVLRSLEGGAPDG